MRLTKTRITTNRSKVMSPTKARSIHTALRNKALSLVLATAPSGNNPYQATQANSPRTIQRASRLAIRPVMGTASTNPILPANVRTISSAMGSRLIRCRTGS